MNLKSSILACTCLLLSSSVSYAETISASGQDNKIEWKTASSWKMDGKPVDLVHSLDGKMVFILDNQHRVLIYDSKGQLQGRIPVGEGVTAIDIAPQGETLYLIDEQENSFTQVTMSYVHEIDITGSPLKGDVNAPVTVAVFTDFE